MKSPMNIVGAALIVLASAASELRSQAINNLPPAVQEQLQLKQDFLSGGAYMFFFGRSSTNTDPTSSGCQTGKGPQPACAGPNIQVDNRNEDSTSVNGIVTARFRGQSETTIAVSGSNLVVAWNDATGFFVPGKGLSGVGYSTDGGQTWCDAGGFFNPDTVHVPFGDNTAVADNNGNFFIGYLYDMPEAGQAPISTLAVTHITPATLASRGCPANIAGENNIGEAPVIAAVTASDFLDKPWLAIDANPNPSTGLQAMYMCYTRFVGIAVGDGQIELIRSLDGGKTWNGLLPAGQPGGPAIVQPDQVSPNFDTLTLGKVNQGCYVTVGANHEVYVVWENGWLQNGDSDPSGNTPAILFAKSLDFGKSFSTPARIASFNSLARRPPKGYNRTTINDFPKIDVARGLAGGNLGTLYVTWQAAPAVRSPLADVLVAVSQDAGATWGGPLVANTDSPGTNLHFMPAISVDAFGNANIIFYDRRQNPFTPSPFTSSTTGSDPTDPGITNLFAAQIQQGGAKIVNWQISDVASPWLAARSNIRPNFGDYIHGVSLGTNLFASWADSRNDNTPSPFFSLSAAKR